MADIKQGAAPAPAAAQAPVRKRLPKKLIIIVAAALLLGASAAGAFIYLNRSPAPAADAARKGEPRKLPNFVDLDQFTVNLAEKDQDRYMQIKFSLEVASREAEATIKEMMPALRSEILLALGARQASDLASREGKEALAKDIVDAANKSLDHTPAERSVTAVRITQLIIQ
ncbi:MAG TPA: flagellar basal body-associated FliL family protein [Burkholderiaceae bacterium]|jgi:flagellar FliL protein|nr:flagellar basal body-associated FliL family protein [Burkholderiaceae bacterium]